VVGAVSSNVIPLDVHCSAGIRAEGTTVIEPCFPGMVKWKTTVAD
jgi:hypothetical protein